ncbi:Glutaredoxin-1 [Tulasnella sp. JGI-2019a]|nr:Glutaredoxin-1 [Tulasnella sp. JGI-2019a]KAG9013211.1 Glutaredoxin-1 [Tulasnella sp. JGI-2019a]
MTVKETVDSAIADHKIVIFAKSYCPHCKAAKKLLIDDLELGDEVTVYELDQLADGTERQDYLLEKTGQRTVPNIFINQKHIGGNDTLQALNKDGKLAGLLAA